MTLEGDLYETVEAMVQPIIKSNARRFRRQLGMTTDEAEAEARYGLMLALRKYDYNDARGGIYNFAATAVRRHFLKVWAHHRAQQRHPHLIAVDSDGKRRALPSGFVGDGDDVIDALPGLLGAPEGPLMLREGVDTAERLRAALKARLNERDQLVLECKIAPPRGLQMLMCEECVEEPTIPMIGQHLGLTKNAVDWALKRIREATVDLIASEFSELASLTVVQGYTGRR